MRILFFDLEYASCKNGCKICEFGYVITNEKFEIIERNNLIINPYISTMLIIYYISEIYCFFKKYLYKRNNCDINIRE